jgi:hypothetical protein
MTNGEKCLLPYSAWLIPERGKKEQSKFNKRADGSTVNYRVSSRESQHQPYPDLQPTKTLWLLYDFAKILLRHFFTLFLFFIMPILMKRTLSAFLRCLLCSGALLLAGLHTYANHVKAAELRYKWISGLTYEIDLSLYGDCSSAITGVSSSFYTLPVSAPQVCIYSGSAVVATVNLSIVDTAACGREVSQICPDSASSCVSPSSQIPGIKKFMYTATYTFTSSESCWRIVYNGNNGAGGVVPLSCTGNPDAGDRVTAAVAGRSTAITNLAGGTTDVQLIDTLNTTTARGHNSSPELAMEPVPSFCAFAAACYNPAAADIFDTSTSLGEPDGDSLVFSLVPPTQGSTSCGAVGGPCSYMAANAWTTPAVQALDGAHPLQCTSGATFSFNSTTGQLCFNGITQNSTVVYNIEEYDHGVLTGTMQREMNFYVEACGSTPCSTSGATTKISSPSGNQQATEIYPNPANTALTISAAGTVYNVSIINLLGQTVYSQNYNAQNVQVDVSGLVTGIYYVKINGAEVKKFLKE